MREKVCPFHLNTIEPDNSFDSIIQLDYFEIMILLHYLEGKSEYQKLIEQIEKGIIEKIKREDNFFIKSENTLLFLDLISCPYLDTKTKRSIMRESKYAQNNASNTDVDILIKEIANFEKWFMNWESKIDLERILKKKEWGSTY